MSKRAPKRFTTVASSEEFFLAQGRWVNFWLKQGREVNSIPSFAEFLGLTAMTRLASLPSSGNEIYDLGPNPEASPRVKMLCGPHWYALLKAYQLSKGNDGG